MVRYSLPKAKTPLWPGVKFPSITLIHEQADISRYSHASVLPCPAYVGSAMATLQLRYNLVIGIVMEG